MKSTIFKSIICLSVAFLLSNLSSAQEAKKLVAAYKIISNTSKSSNTFYIDALKSANMEHFRLKEKDVEIKFKEGVVCLIISAISLAECDNKIDIAKYRDSFSDEYKLPQFSVNPNGHLLADYPKKRK